MSKRLIDANELISAMYYYEHNEGGLTAYDAQDIINKAPTIETKRGEWIEHKERTIVRDNNFIDFFPTEYECSNCGLRQATYFINSTLPNFCPNCGADMRKGADDGNIR